MGCNLIRYVWAVALLVLVGLSGSASAAGGRWSYPGDLRSHLMREHGASVQGLSRQQMLELHDALHEQRRAVSGERRVVRGQVFRLLRRR